LAGIQDLFHRRVKEFQSISSFNLKVEQGQILGLLDLLFNLY